ncbi:MFS transporter [Natrinema halophilum]|uniref:MFS transporter n=1 Tax=Natrinema halophilum TaxID=1699371 RepID=A0A7D5H465_9EURY|nr:MFS transporter [Natrinema halophilum]QLG50371.1 MFS transporter [Natrinema halophilum]
MEIISSIGAEVDELWGEGRGPLLATIASGWGVLLGTRMIYPVLIPHLRTSFDLSLTVAGFLVTILWLGAALGQLPGGVLADRYSERLIMTVGAFVVAVAIGCVVAASSPIVLFVMTGFIGFGQSLYPIARITIISDIYPDRIGSALGVTMAMGDLGQTIFPPIAAALAAGVFWQAGLGFMIPLLVIVGISLWVVLPVQTPTESGGDTLSPERARYVIGELRQSNLAFVTFILFLYIITWQSFTGLYPTYLVEVKGMSSATAGLLFSSFFACGVLVKPLAGAAYDRIGTRSALLLVLIGPVIGLGLLPVIEGFWLLVGATALVSTMLGSGAITQSFLSDAIAEDIQGTGLGVIRTISATCGAVGPVFFGGLADRGYFDEGYLLLAGILAVTILLTLRLPQPSSS